MAQWCFEQNSVASDHQWYRLLQKAMQALSAKNTNLIYQLYSVILPVYDGGSVTLAKRCTILMKVAGGYQRFELGILGLV